MARNYKKIVAWQRGHELTLEVYRITQSFPAEEKYGLTSQLRRAAYSVPVNIAEGAGRETHKDYLRFLVIGLASLNEVEYFLMLARDLNYLSPENHIEISPKVNSTFATLRGLMKAVKKEL